MLLLVEADTGKILYERIQRKRDENFLKDPIKLSEKALALNDNEGAGTLPMEGTEYTVEQLLTAL